MKYKPTKKGTFAVIFILAMFLLAGWIEKGMATPGGSCTWDSDCSIDERCVSVRKGWVYPKICLPKDYKKPDPLRKDIGVD